MSNQFDMICPNCGADDEIEIEAKVWVKLAPDGTDANGDHEWDNDSSCICNSCFYQARVKDFEND